MDANRTAGVVSCYRPLIQLVVAAPRVPDVLVAAVQRSVDRQTSKENHPMHLAYLDAASGSMIVQAVVAGVAGVAVFAKVFWRRLTTPFRRKAEVASQTNASTHETVGAKGDER
jgi:hypothetical protein